MLTESRYPIKYPYASERFHQSLKVDLDKAGEIPKLENFESHTKKDKQILGQANFILRSLNSIFTGLSDSLFPFFENIFKFGINKSSEESTEISLSKKIETELDRIFQLDQITNADSNPQRALSEELISTTEKQKLHGKGLVMNFLRDYVLERNFLQLAPENTVTDATGTSWTSSAVSLTGDHTKAVNSDAYQEPKNGSRILGLVADGVTCCSNPIDAEEIAKIKANAEDELLMERQEDPNREKLKALYKKDTDSHGSHYFSKLLSQSVNEFVVPAAFLCDVTDIDLTAQATTTAQKLIKYPNYFWSDLVPYLVENELISPSTKNFFQDVSACLEEDAWKLYLNQEGYPDLDLALKNKEVQQYLVAMMPLSKANLAHIAHEFVEVFHEKDKSITAATHLSYAMDLGDKIALVRIGDSPIKALDKDTNIIEADDNYSFADNGSKGIDKITSDISIEIDRTQNPDQDPKIEVGDRIVVELVDKAKVAYIAIASDGICEKKDFKQRVSGIFQGKSNPSSKEVINKALELSTDTDDRTMVVLKRNP